MDLYCAWCLSKHRNTGNIWSSQKAVTIYKGQALCLDHYEETRDLEPVKAQ